MNRVFLVIVGVLLLSACTSGGAGPASQQPPAGSAAPAGGSQAPAGGSGAAGGTAGGYEGSVTTSGLYAATWSAVTGSDGSPFNSLTNPSLTSDKGTFGNIKVETDGTVEFGSGADELSAHGLTYTGNGANVTLDATGQFVCAFTVDTALAGDDGAKLHIAGTMTAHWQSAGNLSCP